MKIHKINGKHCVSMRGATSSDMLCIVVDDIEAIWDNNDVTCIRTERTSYRTMETTQDILAFLEVQE